MELKFRSIKNCFWQKHYPTHSYETLLHLLLGASGAHAVTIIFTPLISNLYGPKNLGMLGVFMAAVAIMVPITTLTYPLAIVLAKEDEVAMDMAILCLYVIAIVCLAGSVLVLTNQFYFSYLLGEYLAAPHYVALLMVSVFLSGTRDIIHYLLTRKKNFRLVAKMQFLQGLFVNVIKVIAGLFMPTAFNLLVVTVFGLLVHTVLLAFGMGIFTNYKIVQKFKNFNCMCQLAYDHYDFPMYRAPQVLINTLSMSLPVMVLSWLNGVEAAGHYTLVATVLNAPVMIVSKSVGEVFYQHIVDSKNKELALFPIMVRATIGLVAIGFIPFGIIVLFGPSIFALVFGIEWAASGEYARWLAALAFFRFINSPTVNAVPVLNIQHWLLQYELFSTGAKLLSLYGGIMYLKNDVLGIAIFSLSGIFAYVYMITYILIRSKNFDLTVGNQ